MSKEYSRLLDHLLDGESLAESQARSTAKFYREGFPQAAVDADGNDIESSGRVLEMTGSRLEVVIEEIPAPAFLSFNRDCSFYGTFADRSATPEQLTAAQESVRLLTQGRLKSVFLVGGGIVGSAVPIALMSSQAKRGPPGSSLSSHR